ncbi:hypothetical protein [Streptomyces sp. NPDC059943]|uniref:hypothetical protein n=1 Tax=Streptomyces sp. NPDC059943 TaxID=3347010 RepID=UPI00365BBA4E
MRVSSTAIAAMMRMTPSCPGSEPVVASPPSGCTTPPPGVGARTTVPRTGGPRCPSSCSRIWAAAPERGDQEPEAEHGETVDLSALRALKKSRTDVEALGFADEQLRRLQGAYTRAGDQSRERTARHADRQDDDAPQLLRENDGHQAHRPRQPGPHRGPEVGR